jgi:hypothetical protein
VFEQKGFYKIGISNNPARRLVGIQASTPFDVRIILVIKLDDDAEPIEAELHDYFSAKKERGEWFRLSEEDLSFIRGYILENKVGATVEQFSLVE